MAIPLLRTLLAGLACALAAAPALAESQPGDVTQAERPAPAELRYEEDWSVLPTLPDEAFWDFVKHATLGTDGWLWLSAGGQIRLRGEGWSNDGFGAGETNDALIGLGRFRLHGDLHLTEWVRVFAEGKAALATRRRLPGGRRPLDVDKLDVQNLFVDLRVPLPGQVAVTARVGRQELSLGAERLVSARDWANSRRTFDAARLVGEWRRARVDAFYGRPVVVEPDEVNRFAEDVALSGVYATGPAPLDTTLDLYWLWLQRDLGRWGSLSGEEARHTLGLRLASALRTGFATELEGALQVGELAGSPSGGAARRVTPITAGFVAGQLAYTAQGAMQVRGETGFDWASGDDDPGDRNIHTFDPLFGHDHVFYGVTDKVGRQNATDVWGRVSFEPHGGLRLGVMGRVLQLVGRQDALYDGDGNAVVSSSPYDPRRVATEWGLTGEYVLSTHTRFDGGYAWLVPGELARRSLGSATTHFGFVQYAYTF